LAERKAGECVGCHAKDDVHKGQEGKRCEQCHQEANWKTSSFDHARARFALVGSHLTVACNKCHVTARFKDAKSECVACHQKDDVHKRRLGTQCDTCHNPRTWKGWDFDHARKTQFLLDGAHRNLRCEACHNRPVDGRPTLPTTCASCHAGEDVHDGAFGRQCEQCHVTSSFKTVDRRAEWDEGAVRDASAPSFVPDDRAPAAAAAWIWHALAVAQD
jgi:hypothetical protein